MLSTSFNSSLLARNITRSSFSKIKSDLGITTLLALKTAPILISSGKFDSFKDLLSSSDYSKISASINSYSPSSTE